LVKNLQDRTALVTGSSRGIGAAIARKLALHGAEVFIHGSRDTEVANRLVDEIRSEGGKAEFLVANLLEPDSVVELFGRLGGRAETLDILINNAGIFGGEALASLELEQIQRVLAVNVTSLIVVTREFVRRTKSRNGRIINISSLAGRLPGLNVSLYAASKAAVDALTRCWSLELGPRGMTVNSVSPGMVDTEMSAQHITNRETVLRGVALRRMGLPEDIADVVLFLASEQSRWVTGQVIGADGGQVAAATVLRTL
jgi:3-oxoacyl-[acyl-carrier protein] reductase